MTVLLRRFEGRSELRTYLAVVLQRAFIDFRRRNWGLWRPSAEARRLGPVGSLLDRLISRDGMSVDEAVETVLAGVGSSYSREELSHMADRLPKHPPPRMVDEEALLDFRAVAETAESSLLRDEREKRAARVRETVRSLLQSLDAEDAVILRFRFENGLSVAQMAKLLQLDPKPLYRRVERLLARLRSGLKEEGVAPEEVGELLDAGAFQAARHEAISLAPDRRSSPDLPTGGSPPPSAGPSGSLASCPDRPTVVAEALRQRDELRSTRRWDLRVLLPALAAAAVVTALALSRLLIPPAAPPATRVAAVKPAAPPWAAGGPWEPGIERSMR